MADCLHNTLLELANLGASLRVGVDKFTPEVAKELLAVGGNQICFEVG
ncbi:MAG: hypothetical protein KBF68_03775 [Nitrosomonas sp.]|nr:hypothetical protein [Nitrosomonas sp.]